MIYKRLLIKAISYRILATAALGIVSWVFTGDFLQTSAITITFAALATLLYYIHERIWSKIKWGRSKR